MKHIFVVLFTALVSCSTPNKLHKLMDKLPEATTKECSQRFPIKETIDTIEVTDVVILQAYQDEYTRLNIIIDSLLNAGCDTIVIDSIKTVIKQLPAKTNTRVIVKTQESTAKLDALKIECDKKQAELVTINNKIVTDCNVLKNKNTKLQKQNRWLWIVVILMAIWMNRKRILSLLKSLV